MLVGCGSKDSPAPAKTSPPKSSKTKAEKADALLRHVSGKETAVVTKLIKSIDENQRRALEASGEIKPVESK
jgi:ABC-type Zn uptake system ZnuABC Zn-binding protein ZnuA